MITRIYELGALKQYKYVIVVSEYNGAILLSRHKDRTTWETQGGHIEAEETPFEAAKRELYEESGASDFEIVPVCDYRAGTEGTESWANGVVFSAKIRELSPLPESEMAEVRSFRELPENLTYPDITPTIFEYTRRRK